MLVTVPGMLYNSLSALYAIIIVLSALNKTSFSYMNDFDSILKEPFQPANLQVVLYQQFAYQTVEK